MVHHHWRQYTLIVLRNVIFVPTPRCVDGWGDTMVLPDTFHLDPKTNTLVSQPRPGTSGPYTNTWQPQNAIKEQLFGGTKSPGGAFTALGQSIYAKDPIHKTAAKVGLSYLGLGGLAAAADATTKGFTALAGGNKIAEGFINYGPLGALYAGIRGA